MIQHPAIAACFLVVAVAICLISALGLAVMRDPYQRLQFCTPVASLAVPLFAIAVWIADPDWQARIKSALIATILAVSGAVLSHATARAIRIRDLGHWPPSPAERSTAPTQPAAKDGA
jgi:monovalent cation/proton antiporter MnhG/PhaG subunit